MKKVLFIKLLVVSVFFVTPLTATAQVGVNPIYGSGTEGFGVRFEAYFPTGRHFRLGGNFNLFFPASEPVPEEPEFTQDISRWGVNINTQYRVFRDVFLTPYFMGGFSLVNLDIDVEDRPDLEPDGNSQLALNAGGGIELSISFGFLYLEYKRVFGEELLEQGVASGGLRVGLN